MITVHALVTKSEGMDAESFVPLSYRQMEFLAREGLAMMGTRPHESPPHGRCREVPSSRRQRIESSSIITTFNIS